MEVAKAIKYVKRKLAHKKELTQEEIEFYEICLEALENMLNKYDDGK